MTAILPNPLTHNIYIYMWVHVCMFYLPSATLKYILYVIFWPCGLIPTGYQLNTEM